MGNKGWRKDGKTFMRYYTIALTFWDDFNANFLLLCFSSYIKVKKNLTPLSKKYGKNNKVGHLRLLFTYLHQNLFNIKKHLALVLKKIAHAFFCVFQTNLNKAVNIFWKLPEWFRNTQMIRCYNTIKTWMRILHG